jgi:hypothetical protein
MFCLWKGNYIKLLKQHCVSFGVIVPTTFGNVWVHSPSSYLKYLGEYFQQWCFSCKGEYCFSVMLMCARWFRAHSLSKTPKDKSDVVRSGDPDGHKFREVTRLLQNQRIMNNVQFGWPETCERRWQTRLIILHPFKPMFYKLLRPKTGMAKVFEDACPNCG